MRYGSFRLAVKGYLSPGGIISKGLSAPRGVEVLLAQHGYTNNQITAASSITS